MKEGATAEVTLVAKKLVLQDLLVIDHTNSQFGRRAQVISVLSGSWPGRRVSVSRSNSGVEFLKASVEK